VVVTVSTPYSFFAVTSQAMRDMARPRTGEAAAATRFWPFQTSVMAPGNTADEMMTPMSR
jgi:hypothetical protein